jgi:ParB family chromosome partitioning protein
VGEFRLIPLELIDPPENAWRKDISPEAVQLLAESIRSVGLLQPIGVVECDGRYRVVYGHRRLLACQWCRLDPVPCFLGESGAEAEGLRTGAENLARHDLTCVEEAQALRGLIDGRGLTVDAAARALGRSSTWVRLRLELLRWPESFVSSLGSGLLSVSVARELVGIEDVGVREHYRKCAEESGCTAWQARQWRKDWEVSALPRREGEELPPMPPMIGKPPVPMMPCGLCDKPHEVTGLGFVRICRECAIVLERAKYAPADESQG